MIRLLGIAAMSILLLAQSVGVAAPNREPRGPAGAMAPELPRIDLTKIPDGDGAVFGDWILWKHQVGGNSIFLIHQTSGLTVYLPWGSNGWINYRKAGAWHVLFPTGEPQLQDRGDLNLEKFLGRGHTIHLAPGMHVIENWTVTITNEAIHMKCSQIPANMTIPRLAPEFTHNARTIR